MSSRSRSYSRESHSYYSRSSSYENKRSNNSSYHRRPLSSLLIERDFSSPPSIDFDDSFLFDLRSRRFLDDFDRRLHFRFDDIDKEFLGNRSMNIHQRTIPINYQQTNNSSRKTRTIPVQYQKSFRRNENRISSNDWPIQQEAPTRKRTSMTIYLRQPHIQYSDASDHQRTTYKSN